MTLDAQVDRIERLLALLLLQNLEGRPQRIKAMKLANAGFSNVEIADLLETSSAVVRKYLSEGRRMVHSEKKGKRK